MLNYIQADNHIVNRVYSRSLLSTDKHSFHKSICDGGSQQISTNKNIWTYKYVPKTIKKNSTENFTNPALCALSKPVHIDPKLFLISK